MLERMVYCSRATVPTESLLVIADILAVSQRNNERDGLTGALAINDGWFLQVVEGPRDSINQLIRRLEKDPRHRDMEILTRRPVEARLFVGWSMTSARITPDLKPDLVKLVNGCQTSPEDAVAALVRLVEAERTS